jgi:hypothetical protein
VLAIVGVCGVILFLCATIAYWVATSDRKYASSKYKRRCFLLWEKRFLREFPRFGRKALQQHSPKVAANYVQEEMMEWIIIAQRTPAKNSVALSKIAVMYQVATEKFKLPSEAELLVQAEHKPSESTQARRE